MHLSSTSVATITTFDREAWAKGYISCEKETVEELISNDIPKDLQGTFFRNGHAKFEFGKELVMHPFDGDGMISAITFMDGKALFRNRFIRTKGYVLDSKYKRVMTRGIFGTKKSGFLANFLDTNLKITANTNVLFWDKKLLALQEAGVPYYLEPDSLRTLGQYTIRGLLKKSSDQFTAHPRICAKTGHLVAFSCKKGKIPSEITIYEFDKDLKLMTSRDIAMKSFSVFHDFAITENYYIFVAPPTGFDSLPFVLGQKSAAASLTFDANKPSQIYIIPRDASKEVVTIDIPSNFVFHFGNAYEEGDKLVLDLAEADRMEWGAELAQQGRPVWETADFDKDIPVFLASRYTLRKSESSQWSLESKDLLSKRPVNFLSVSPTVTGAKVKKALA
jgi:all-trans-8'-apo-beta-carotenal 15,15'-oxygenase